MKNTIQTEDTQSNTSETLTGVEKLSNQQWLTDKITNLEKKAGIDVKPAAGGKYILAGLDAPVIMHGSDESKTLISISKISFREMEASEDTSTEVGSSFILEGDSIKREIVQPGDSGLSKGWKEVRKEVLEKALNAAAEKMIKEGEKRANRNSKKNHL